jgi:hypothetical protein
MSAIVVAGDTSGSVTLNAPAVSGSTVITLPTVSGTMMVNGPAFSAYAASPQTITGGVVAKVLFGTEEFDTNNNFASSTFTPTVAGYYQVSTQVQTGTAQTRFIIYLFKNGVGYKTGNDLSATAYSNTMSTLVYMNGSTDYLDVYAYFGTTGNTQNTISTTWFNGSMVRGA